MASMAAQKRTCPRHVWRVTAVLIPLFLVSAVYLYYRQMPTVQLQYMVDQWPGFGAQKGVYNFTVVTGMIDIGRGSWAKQRRGYRDYLLYMSQVLLLDVNMVVFVETKGKSFVEWMRRGREKQTKILPVSLANLPYFKYRDRMNRIMQSEEFKRDNELLQQGDHCEATNPDYDILQLSKIHLVTEAIKMNPFDNSYYFWLDGGYGHGGKGIFPKDGIWNPYVITRKKNKLTFLQLSNIEEWEHVKDLHKKNINVLAGGVFGGGVDVLFRYRELHTKLIEEWMHSNIVDDDQTANLQLYFRDRSMFNLVKGDWFDIFKIT